MKFKPSTIKDIALALGLSTSTVSRALRDSYEIKQETKDLVIAYAKKINYQANPIAQSLKERKSYSIGIIVSEIANTFFSQVINGVESVAHKRKYQVIITQSHESYQQERINAEYLASRSIDGLLVALSSETNDPSYLADLYKMGLPIVFFDRVPEHFETHKVTVNNFQGAFDATEYLIQKGYKRIAHITNTASLSISKERLEGYQAALEKHHLEFDPQLLKFCEKGGMLTEELDLAAEELVSAQAEAVFIASDRLTTGFMLAINRLGVPALDIAGFTNSEVVDLFSPAIKAVRQPAFQIGQVATGLLIDMIESKYPVTEFQHIVLETEI